MEDRKRQQIANFNYSLIAPVVCKTNLGHGEEYEILRQVARGEYDIPYSTRKTVSLRTLERYLRLYREGGLEALKPKKRTSYSRIPLEYKEQAALLRRENKNRSIVDIISMLEKSGRVPKGVLKRSTVYDYFVKVKLAGKNSKKSRGESYRKYSASYRGEILQGDVHHTLYLPNPSRPGQKRKVYLFGWLDDYSRLGYGEFYFKEKLPSLENTFKKWIIRYGVPETIYADNGAVYSSHYLETICGNLGIHLTHSRPYKPQGRGKIEKFFQFVESSFKSEAYLLIKDNKIENLDQLNSFLLVWMDKFYNEKVHSSTKQKPIIRWESGENELKKPDLKEISEAFLFEGQATVSKVGIIRLQNNEYEVDSVLAGKRVTVKYDPYNLEEGIRVFYEDQRYGDAIPAKIRRHHHKKFIIEKDNDDEQPVHSGLNHLEVLKKEAEKNKKGVSFSDLEHKKEADVNDS